MEKKRLKSSKGIILDIFSSIINTSLIFWTQKYVVQGCDVVHGCDHLSDGFTFTYIYHRNVLKFVSNLCHIYGFLLVFQFL